MTAPDTSDRGVTAQGGAQTWRAVLEHAHDGDRIEVAVTVVAPQTTIPRWWEAQGRGFVVGGYTERHAVLMWTRTHASRVPVEILAPGELSRAELIAERDAAVARAVAEEREACAEVARSHGLRWFGAAMLDAFKIADAIRTRGGAQ